VDLVARRRVGGWAVLVYLLASFGVALAAGGILERTPQTVFVLGVVRGASLALTAWGLAAITTKLADHWSRAAMWAGVIAGALVVADGIATALAMDLSEWTWLPAGLAFVTWMAVTGVILASADHDLHRIGLLGEIAAAGSLVALVVTLVVQVDPRAASFFVGLPLGLLSVFAFVYLVRLFALAALERGPGPGRI
jgi:hypothetical protein